MNLAKLVEKTLVEMSILRKSDFVIGSLGVAALGMGYYLSDPKYDRECSKYVPECLYYAGTLFVGSTIAGSFVAKGIAYLYSRTSSSEKKDGS